MQQLVDKSLTIEKKREGEYFEIPFTVPKNIEKIEISYDYQRFCETNCEGKIFRKEINIVDIGLIDGERKFRGFTGSEKRCFYLTDNEATTGYLPGEIRAGEWAVIFGAYLIQPEGLPVTLTITLTEKKPVLLKGDLHMHSGHSDGKYSLEETVNLARLHGLDFIFVTDHNCTAHNELLRSCDELVVMPGMEWTHYKGHGTMLGLKRPVNYFLANDKDEVAAVFREARDNGAFVALAHPFCDSCGWNWGFDVPHDGLEIWNGPMKLQEMRAIAFWHEQLCQGKRIPAVGGSDAHRNELFRMIGCPTTFVYSASRARADILDAIKNGHSFIGFSPDAPRIDLQIAGCGIGRAVSFVNADGIVTVNDIKAGDEIRIISNQGTIGYIAEAGQCGWSIPFVVEHSCKFYRVEIWRELIPGMKTLVVVSNPVYNRCVQG